MSSYTSSNTLRFTDDFLNGASSLLSTEELQRLAVKISDDPLSGHKADEIDDLFFIDWVYFSDGEKVPCRIWYVASENTSHIEVVALTTVIDDATKASPDDLDEAIRNTKKLVKLARLFQRFVDIIRDIMNDPPDFPDIGMF